MIGNLREEGMIQVVKKITMLILTKEEIIMKKICRTLLTLCFMFSFIFSNSLTTLADNEQPNEMQLSSEPFFQECDTLTGYSEAIGKILKDNYIYAPDPSSTDQYVSNCVALEIEPNFELSFDTKHVLAIIKYQEMYYIQYDSEDAAKEAAEELRQTDGVKYAEVDAIVDVDLPGEPFYYGVLKPEIEKAIRKDYYAKLNDTKLKKEYIRLKYYGTYQGNEVVLMDSREFNYTQEIVDIYVGKYKFHFTSGIASQFYLYKNRTFIPVKEAYEKGYLNDGDVARLSFIFEKVESSGMSYQDMKESSWCYFDVEDAFNRGIMFGLDQNTFGPAGNISRGQFVTILHRMENSPAAAYSSKFLDVADGLFYSQPVMWTTANNIVKGYNNQQFGPADHITREQLVTMLYRYAQYKQFIVHNKKSLDTFPDGAKVSDFAKEAMEWAIANHIIEGKDGHIAPQDLANRGETAAIINRFIAY